MGKLTSFILKPNNMAKTKKKRTDLRSLTVNGVEWGYKIGKTCIAIHDPNDKRYFPKIDSLIDSSSIGYRITPALILNYIKVVILKEEAVHSTCCDCGIVSSNLEVLTFDGITSAWCYSCV